MFGTEPVRCKHLELATLKQKKKTLLVTKISAGGSHPTHHYRVEGYEGIAGTSFQQCPYVYPKKSSHLLTLKNNYSLVKKSEIHTKQDSYLKISLIFLLSIGEAIT